MSAAAIDSKVLNNLFDNPKKLDDLFDSIFEDDNYFISSVSSSQSDNLYAAPSTTSVFASKQSWARESLFTINEQHPYFFVLPLMLEIAAIYFVVTHLL